MRTSMLIGVCQFVLNRSLSKVGLLVTVTPLSSSDTSVQVSRNTTVCTCNVVVLFAIWMLSHCSCVVCFLSCCSSV